MAASIAHLPVAARQHQAIPDACQTVGPLLPSRALPDLKRLCALLTMQAC